MLADSNGGQRQMQIVDKQTEVDGRIKTRDEKPGISNCVSDGW